MADRPNVVLVTCHDLGRHLGCYGRDVETPNADEMAAAGVRFENAFCTAPQCSPSRGSVATGVHPHEHGLLGLAHRGWELEERHLAARMRGAGYDTHLVGFQHETDWGAGADLGYEHVHNESADPKVQGRALDVADRFDGVLAAAEPPFFAAVGFEEPHGPYRREYVPEAAYERYDADSVTPLPHLAGDEGHLDDLAAFNALVTATTDRALGRVRGALREHGVADDTVLVFTTDHGVNFPAAKLTCYDAGVETALLVEAPGSDDVGTGETVGTTVQNTDLFATVLDVAGAPVPDIDGRSLVPLLTGDPDGYDPRDALYFEQTWHGTVRPIRAVRADGYKYVRNFRPRVSGDGPDRPPEELYDLDADPHEDDNLLGDGGAAGAHEAVHDRLADSLGRWMVETGDPLAGGHVPLPHEDRAWFDGGR
ncbi:MAG: sulfatase-like hydrolase/transferase [Halobacteriaceae archaeon]